MTTRLVRTRLGRLEARGRSPRTGNAGGELLKKRSDFFLLVFLWRFEKVAYAGQQQENAFMLPFKALCSPLDWTRALVGEIG